MVLEIAVINAFNRVNAATRQTTGNWVAQYHPARRPGGLAAGRVCRPAATVLFLFRFLRERLEFFRRSLSLFSVDVFGVQAVDVFRCRQHLSPAHENFYRGFASANAAYAGEAQAFLLPFRFLDRGPAFGHCDPVRVHRAVK
jgi:hypothetical protein